MIRIEILLAVHNALCESAGLPENQRPYFIQQRIDEVQRLILEELRTKPAQTEPNDDIPF